MNEQDSTPLVSVIIPAYNEAETLPELISSLRGQDYPPDKIEILIVDNNSTDNTEEIIRGQGLTYLCEKTPSNSYAARNRGIENSNGEVLAFTDGDCRVDREWIKQGVKCLRENDADMAAGHSVYEVPEKSISGRYSRSSFGRQKLMVESIGGCATNNLFMTRKVVEKMGGFDQRFNYGGDTHYTSRASANGFRMVYCPNTRIYHAAHAGLKEISKKWWRYGFASSLKVFYAGQDGYAFKQWRWYVPGMRRLWEFRQDERLGNLETFKAFFIVWMTKLAYVKGSYEGYQNCRKP
ncbi:MAG: glycosyltransferase [bacterium]